MIGNIFPENNLFFSSLSIDPKENSFKKIVKISVGTVSFSLIALVAFIELFVHTFLLVTSFVLTYPFLKALHQKKILDVFMDGASSSARVGIQAVRNLFHNPKTVIQKPPVEPPVIDTPPVAADLPNKEDRGKIIARGILKGIALTLGSLALTYYLIPRIYGVFRDTAWLYEKRSTVNATELASCIKKTHGKRRYRMLDAFEVLKCKNGLGKYFLASDKCRFFKKQFAAISTKIHPDKFQSKDAHTAFSIADEALQRLKGIHFC